MEGFIFKYLSLSGVFLISCCILKIFHVIWWKPKSLEKHLKKLGIRGTSYTLMYADRKETKKLIAEAWSKPMPLSHAIARRVNPMWHQMFHKYGKISLSWLGRRPMLMIADPELMRLILEDKNGHFQKPPGNPLVKQTIGVNIFTLEGEKWAKRRKLIIPAFHYEKLQEMLPAFLTSCCNLIDRWKNMVGSKESSEIDVAQEMRKLAGDVISRAAFGSNFEEGKMIFEIQKERFVLALDASASRYLPGYRFLPTKKNKRRFEIDDKTKAMFKEMIKRRKRAMQNGESKNDDLLSLLLQYQSHSNNDMKIEDVIEECKLFFVVGQETTANWLTWTLIVLSMHPNWQEKARKEVLQIYGKKTPDLKDINQLRTVSMVFQEVFRLYPPVTGLTRYTVQPTDLGGILIPAGVEVVLPTILIHHDPEYWGEDVEEFKPERFSKGVSKASSRDQLAFYPFGWGPRICLGQSFSQMEAKLALAMILQNFSFELSPSYTHAPHTIITLRPQYGAPIIFHKL